MTEFQRLCLARDACWTFTEEIYFNVFNFLKTNAWYDPYLYVLKGLGYDVSQLKINDWNKDLTKDSFSIFSEQYEFTNKEPKKHWLKTIVLKGDNNK